MLQPLLSAFISPSLFIPADFHIFYSSKVKSIVFELSNSVVLGCRFTLFYQGLEHQYIHPLASPRRNTNHRSTNTRSLVSILVLVIAPIDPFPLQTWSTFPLPSCPSPPSDSQPYLLGRAIRKGYCRPSFQTSTLHIAVCSKEKYHHTNNIESITKPSQSMYCCSKAIFPAPIREVAITTSILMPIEPAIASR